MHYHDDSSGWYIGGIFTKKRLKFQRFIDDTRIWIHLGNVLRGNRALLDDKNIVGSAVSFLDNIEDPPNLKAKLPQISPFRSVLEKIIKYYDKNWDTVEEELRTNKY